jgi:hypothetical protein
VTDIKSIAALVAYFAGAVLFAFIIAYLVLGGEL